MISLVVAFVVGAVVGILFANSLKTYVNKVEVAADSDAKTLITEVKDKV